VTETLATYSLIGVYSAMAVYTLAFLFYSVDLSTRAARPAVQAKASSQDSGDTLTLEKTSTRATFYQRAATAMMVIAWLVHLAATILRGLAGGRVPWANMFEFGLTATLLISAVFLGSLLWRDLAYLGAFVSGFVLLALGIVTVNYYVDVVPLPPALQSYWLVIHVFVASLATAFFALGSGLSIYQLIRSRVDRGEGSVPRLMASLPDAATLESLAYRLYVIGFVLWTFTLIAGAVWAERAWGRYWGWDVKEVWTFIIWVFFAGYIHARATRGWRGDRAAWLGLIGFGALIFNYAIVNVFFTGLHSYSGL
jgi:cytochrome c-type biogenesis protein CcsB